MIKGFVLGLAGPLGLVVVLALLALATYAVTCRAAAIQAERRLRRELGRKLAQARVVTGPWRNRRVRGA